MRRTNRGNRTRWGILDVQSVTEVQSRGFVKTRESSQVTGRRSVERGGRTQ